MNIQARLKGAAAPVALSVALIAQPVYAQGEDQPITASDILDEAAADDSVAEEGQIIVTGSRIRRDEATSASPVQIIDPVISRRAGRNSAAEIIQNSPIASGSSQITAAISTFGQGANGGPGAQTISLRGLGAERTLVLLNSRRAGPAGTRGEVSSFDLNVLPGAIIESVEVLKDGASSIYGSDAIAGVVNIITKKKTDGLELDVFGSLPSQSGGEEFNISGAWGKEFDRGHFLIAGDYYRQKMLRRQDRDYLDCDYDYLFSDTTGNDRVDLVDPRTGELWCDGAPWGHVWTYFAGNLPDFPVTLMQYSYGNDNLGAYVPGPGTPTQPGDAVIPAGWFPVSYQTRPSQSVLNSYSPFERKGTILPEVERFTAYADAEFELSDTISVYAEGIFNRRTSKVDTFAQFYNFGYTGMYAPGDPDDPFPGWSGFNGSQIFISPTGILDNYDQEISVDYYRGVLGLKGDLSSKISFDIHGQYSRSSGTYKLDQILQDVITQQTDRAYGYGCAGQFTPISNRECLQINWVDPRVMAGDLTPEEEAYFTETETGKTIYTQMFLEASVNGELFRMPAGPVGFAAGAVIRRDEIDDLPGHITYALVPGGDPNNPDDYIDNAFSNDFSSGHTYGYGVTKEAFAEIEIPLLADKPFFQDLTVSGAARITNVNAVRGVDGVSDESNGNWTYKLMANWQVNDWLRLRGTYGTSYRAPALFEQLLAGQVTSSRQSSVDPCVLWGTAQGITQTIRDNCAADGIPEDHTGAGLPANTFSSGGLGLLDPETSRAWTASVILTPDFSFLPNTDINLTVDYFDIKVQNEIAQLAASEILYECYNSNDFPNNEYCGLFERGADGNPNNVKNIFRKFINIDEQINRGFDFTLRVRQDLGNAGSLSFLGQATLQTKDVVSRLGEFDDLNGEIGDPKFSGTASVVWDVNDWSFYYGIDLIGASSSVEQYLEDNGTLCNAVDDFVPVYGGSYCVRPWTDTVVYHHISVTKEFQKRFEVTMGVANLFNTRPPETSGFTRMGNSPFVSQYDLLGQRFFARVGAKF